MGLSNIYYCVFCFGVWSQCLLSYISGSTQAMFHFFKSQCWVSALCCVCCGLPKSSISSSYFSECRQAVFCFFRIKECFFYEFIFPINCSSFSMQCCCQAKYPWRCFLSPAAPAVQITFCLSLHIIFWLCSSLDFSLLNIFCLYIFHVMSCSYFPGWRCCPRSQTQFGVSGSPWRLHMAGDTWRRRQRWWWLW